MSLKFNSDQQRIEASGVKATGNWTNATYSRTAAGVVNIVSVAHGFIGNEKLYIDFTSGGEVDGTYTVSKVDDDNLSFTSSNLGAIAAGNTLAYKRVRSLNIQGDESIEISIGSGNNEKDALFLNQNQANNVRVGVNTTDPQFELDVEGQIRTTRSIISDTAQVVNLDIQTIINPALNLRAPNLINYEDTDVTSPTFGQTFYPTADTPPLTDQSRRLATTDFVYKVATNDTGGRVYVSQTIGSDLNDGRSAARPVATIKKAAQIAYGLQKATPDPSDEYVTLIVSGGEYLEDNPISLPRNCSLVGDNLRRVIVRPLNQDRHMIKASNETYIFGVVFRDALQNASDPQSTVIHTWKYAFVFDDKQRLYYEPELKQIPAVPGDKFRGENIFSITFANHTGSNTTLEVGDFVQGGSSGTLGKIQTVTFTGPVASPYSTGNVTVLITSGINDVFQDAEKVFYDNVAANIITDLNNAGVSDRFDVADAESLRPELETISNQIYQHTVNSERETIAFSADATKVNTSTDRITITGHSIKTGDQLYYQKDENTAALGGLIDSTAYYARKVDANTIELYDTWANATATVTVTTGRKDITSESPDDKLHLFTTGKIMPESNNIFIDTHGFNTGDGVIYRSSKMGDVAGLTDGTTYYVYVENANWIRLAASAANATQKTAAGADDPITVPITGTGLGYQRFDIATKLLSVVTIDTSLATQATYNGPIINTASTAFHDYEVGQEVILYGFQSSAINFGASTNTSWSLASGLVTVTVSNVSNSLTTALFGNWATLGECGLQFNFSGAGSEALSKTYLMGEFSTGSGTPTLPNNSALGMGYARYNSSNTTITFVLKVADIQSTTNTATATGSTVSILDNTSDLNGRKYITHRIERADGYSTQFVVRGEFSNVGASVNPTGDQSVIASNNYVLASLRNSPYGFTKISQTDRFRDGAESIRANQEFIAQEAYGYVKSHHEKSSTSGSNLVIGPTTFSNVGMRIASPITKWSVSYNKLIVKVNTGHNLTPAYTVTIAGSATAAINGTWPIDDIYDHREFTLDLGTTATDLNGSTGTDGTYEDVRKPFRTPNSFPVNNKQSDAADAIARNAELIAEVAVKKMIADTGYSVPTGTQACLDDVQDFLSKSLYHNLKWGGNDRVYDAANYFLKEVTTSSQSKYIAAFNNARDYAIKVLRNLPILRHPHSTIAQQYELTTQDNPVNNQVIDGANLINANNLFIAEEAVERFVSKLIDVPVVATGGSGASSTITINALNGTTPTNTSPHTFQGLATYQFTPTGAVYNPITGFMDLTISSHPFVDGDRIKIAANSLTFKCGKDGNTANKTYPRTTDPYYDKWIGVQKVDANTIRVNVGPALTDATTHTFQSATTNAIERAAVYNDVGFTQHTVTGANYEPVTGKLTVTIPNHGFTDGEKVQIENSSITFKCDMDDNYSLHPYPRATDPAANSWLTVANSTQNTFEVNVGTSLPVTFTPTNASYDPVTGLMEITIGNHTLSQGTSVKLSTGAITFKCNEDNYATEHPYPRTLIDVHTATTGTTYNPTTGIMNITTSAAHGMRTGDWVKIADDSLTFSCGYNGATGSAAEKTYPRSTDPISGQWQKVTVVDATNFTLQVLDSTPSTNTDAHTFVSAVANGITQKRDRSNDTAIPITATTGTTITLDVGKSSNTTNHTFQSALNNSVVTGGNYTHTFISATTNGLKRATSSTINSYNSAIAGGGASNTYNPTTGDMVLVVGANSLSAPTTHTPSTAAFNPTLGILTITISNHGFSAGDKIKLANNAITFNNGILPGAVGGPSNKWINIFNVTQNTFDVKIGTGSGSWTFSSALTDGVSYATSVVRIAQESLQWSCTHGDQSTKKYPRSTDPLLSPGFTIPNHNQDCKDDVSDVCRAVAYNLGHGGNDAVYDHAGYFVGTPHVDGEEFEARAVFELASNITQQIISNETVNVIGWHGYTQTKDLTITVSGDGCASHKSTVDTLFSIVEQAIVNDSLSHATDTAATNPTCSDVVSAVTTFFSTLTTALGSDGAYGNLDGVTRTFSPGDQQCLDDILHILRAFQYDLRYGGNSSIVEAANKYISSGAIAHVTEEVDYTRAIFAYAKELAIKAIRNDLEPGFYSQITPVGLGSTTVDPSAPECANVVSALTTNWGILDNVLSSATLYTGTITAPDPVITEQDSNKYSFPLGNVFLDLPVIEASPYIQNSSLISFLGGSGCEIDGAKVATPNVPRPGLKQNAQGNTVAQFDPQGKSMVANAFTIICFGGTAYNVTNDGYTQLVSVFAIFCQDGILVQSGGYASVTNSASNFGTFSLRATGFRAEAYSFDVGVIDSIVNDVDGNGVPTGRQIIQISGTTLTNIPVEDYIIKIDGTTLTNPAVETIILETNVISGAPGSQIVAKITTNISMSYTDSSNGTVYSYAANNLNLLAGKTIRLHRPSVCNSSSHTWEFSGSGNTYAALPQNGGFGLGSAYEAAEQSFGQVYTSGTNEFGDFKVGNFVTIFNRTGAISFVGTVSISELSSIKIVGGAITITGFSDDDNLGGTFASDALLPTQASVRDYISNNLGPYLNQPFSTNAVPSALVQLTSNGKINIDQIPALRPFNITSVASTAARLAIEDANAGDIAIETTSTTFSVAPASVNTSNNQITISNHGTSTGDQLTYTAGTTAIGGLSTATVYYVIKVDDNTIKLATTTSNATNGQAVTLSSQGSGTHSFETAGTAVSYILENDLESQFLAFTPNSAYQFTNGDIIAGSSTTARGTVTNYNDGLIFNFVISDGGSQYSGDFALTISAPDDTSNGVQAAATANVTSGVVTKVTITNPGKGYYNQPTVQVQTSPGGASNNAVVAAQIEGRVNINIANAIKFDAGDFILDQALANLGTGTYSQTGTTITVTENTHNLSNASLVYLDFTSGTAADGFYTISLINSNQYSVTATTSATTSGNFNRKRIIDLSRVINTSASTAANWTQLTSTNIDASNIVAGTIDPERMANKGTANSYTFLRGDSSWEYAVQSLRPTTQDALLVNGSVTDSSYIDSITITNGGTGYTDGTYQNLPMEGGNVSVSDDGVARATYVVSSGVITSATVTDSGTGYTAGFSVVIPSELGGGSSGALTAVKGTINRAFGNLEIDIRKGDNLTPNATTFGNYGVFRFRKDVANQALGNQTEGGFIIDNDGQVRIDQGPGSKLNADELDGNGGSFYTNASNLSAGTLPAARLANQVYAISISGVADTANRIFNETASLTSNPSPAQAANGLGAALRNNTATGLTDGGTTHGIVTYRREATGSAAIQIGFTDNDNLWIRGNSGGNAVYGNWYKIWSGFNDGASSGLDADKLDGSQGLWYQSGYNVGDTRAGLNHPIGDMFLPEVLGQNKMVFENFYVNDSGLKYTLYIPNFHCATGTGGNITNGGTFTIYSDVGATNNIGSIVVDSNGVQELTHTSGEIYSLVTGTINFVGSNTNANIYVFGPNPGTKWTVSSSNLVNSGSSTLIGMSDAAAGAKLQIGKASVSTTPTLDFRSSGSATNYDVQMIVSGGNSNDGNGTLRFNAGDLTVNGNTIWHAGNDGSSSQLDAHYLDGFTQSTSATANTIARRDASGNLAINDLTADQGTFGNTGTSILDLADGNGITLGKSATHTLSIKSKNDSNQGYIRFGNDTNYFGWNGTYLSYNNVYFRNGRLGIGDSNPGISLQSTGDAAFGTTSRGANTYVRALAGDSYQCGFEAFGNNQGTGYLYVGQSISYGGGIAYNGDNSPSSFGSESGDDITFYRRDNGVDSRVAKYRYNDPTFHFFGQVRSRVAQGTAPFVVASTTVVANLNADLLDGYSATNLPYFSAQINGWRNSSEGQPRFYFANNSHTYFRSGDDFFFRNDADTGIGSLNDNGCWTFYNGSDQKQSTYGLQVNQLNGININASEGLSSGQKSTVLRATGDKQWIDSYGVFKRNRNTCSESITITSSDNCMTAGPITINNGVTITVNDGGSWSVV